MKSSGIEQSSETARQESGSAPLARGQQCEARQLSVNAVEIRGAEGLDPIQVFWQDVGVGQGYVTITCYGCAWTCYFGAMPEPTIREFFACADTGYLLTKLGITPHLYQRKRDHAYLTKIIEAVKASLADRSPSASGG